MSSTILVRTSERQSFLTCRQKWDWSWNQKLRAPNQDMKLVFGDFTHQALALYYKPGRKRGIKPWITFERLCSEREDESDNYIWADDETVDLRELGDGMLHRYVDQWEAADSEYEVLASEQVFRVPIGRIHGDRVVYVGTIDGVWKHLPTKKIRFAEHKTAASITKDALPMDEQVGAYWTFGPRWLKLKGILKSGEVLDGVLYNWLRKALPDPNAVYDEQGRKLNKDGTPSKRQSPPYFDRQLTFRGEFEAQRVKERVWQEVLDMLEAKEGPAKIYKNPGPQFMPNCKFCSFRDMCELHETGNDWKAFMKAAYEEWEPYSPYELPERR